MKWGGGRAELTTVQMPRVIAFLADLSRRDPIRCEELLNRCAPNQRAVVEKAKRECGR